MSDLTRRDFLGTIATVATSAPWVAALAETEPILDLHQHTNYGEPTNRRSNEQLVAHQAYHRVTTTVLLAGGGWMLSELGDNKSCTALQADYPDLFVRYACADPAESRALDVLRGNLQRSAIGIGEMKFHVACDSPEMHRVYKLADEMGVPVLLHFEHENYNTGFERFEAVLKAYPKVNFIGHAPTWWGHISAELDPRDIYPKGPVKPGGITDRLLADHPNIYGDLSADSGFNALSRDPEFARGFIERHNRKLIWGSDCDCHDGRGGGTAAGICEASRSLPLLQKLLPDRAAFRRIVYQNGADLLRLKPA